MIDIQHETLFPLTEVPFRLPRQLDGRKRHVSSIYRWVNPGVRGVRLDTINIGQRRYTSMEALQRFAEACSVGTAAPATIRTTAARRKAEAKTDRELDLMRV